MADVRSSWSLPRTAPIPLRARRALAQMSEKVAPAPRPAPLAPMSAAISRRGAATPPFAKQIGLGFAIFATVLAAALPLALVSEGLALAAAVGVGSVLIALLARRLCIALLIATLLAVLGAFAAAHSVHLSVREPVGHFQLAALAPGAGTDAKTERALRVSVAFVLPVRAEIGGERIPVAGWAFPAALFALWAIGFAAIALNRALVRWLWRRIRL